MSDTHGHADARAIRKRIREAVREQYVALGLAPPRRKRRPKPDIAALRPSRAMCLRMAEVRKRLGLASVDIDTLEFDASGRLIL